MFILLKQMLKTECLRTQVFHQAAHIIDYYQQLQPV